MSDMMRHHDDDMTSVVDALFEQGVAAHRAGDMIDAIERLTRAARMGEHPEPRVTIALARALQADRQFEAAARELRRIVDVDQSFPNWMVAATILDQCAAHAETDIRRCCRLAVLGTSTTTQLLPMLRLACWREGILLETYEAPYDQVRQQVLDPSSALYAFEPDMVVLSMHARDITFPTHSAAPHADVVAEVARWTSLWSTLRSRSTAHIVQHNIAIPSDTPFGHLDTTLPGARRSMLRSFNVELGHAVEPGVSILDCNRLSNQIGADRWFDDRYWHLSKQAVALDHLPLFARHHAAVIGAALGLSRKCLVLDLDNTLWGGVIGEDGLAGIRLGHDAIGEAFVEFQRAVVRLKDRGVILAVCSKNNEADAKRPFREHPNMRLRLDDIAMFVANWSPKPDNLRAIASTLNIGLDAMVFVDDNPVERAAVRQLTPEVDVISLPNDPAQYVRALSNYLMFETSTFTAEDAEKTSQYRARAAAAELQSASMSLDDFHESLNMTATLSPFDAFSLPRVEQLIGKTNQFNLTTRRHSATTLHSLVDDPSCVHCAVSLSDCFTNHGIVGVLIARMRDDALDIDTWLMSCRVIGRTVEDTMFDYLCRRAVGLGVRVIHGTYIPTAKNGMVADLFKRLGFVRMDEVDGTTRWMYDIPSSGVRENPFISVHLPEVAADDAA